MLRFVFVSDTHGRHGRFTIPDGDVLLHCGDFSKQHTEDECKSFARWLNRASASFQEGVFVTAGNHERSLSRPRRDMLNESGARLLLDEMVMVGGVMVYGSPWVPTRGHKHRRAVNLLSAVPRFATSTTSRILSVLGMNVAFTLERGGAELGAKWNAIPDETDVLMTHGPPSGRLDHGCGDELLLERVEALAVAVHAFGHNHSGFGIDDSDEGTLFVNAASKGSVVVEIDARMRRESDGRLPTRVVSLNDRKGNPLPAPQSGG